MAILWRPQLSVGNEDIDQDHKYLFCLVNTIELLVRNGHGIGDVDSVLAQLKVFAQEHFEREQGIQARIAYPDCAEHQSQHQMLLVRLHGISADIRVLCEAAGGVSKERLRQETDVLMPILRHWILDHVLKTDMGMKPYFTDPPDDRASVPHAQDHAPE